MIESDGKVARGGISELYAVTCLSFSDDVAPRDEIVDKLTQTKVVFHGTLRRHVGSIVQSGFVIPGRKTVAGQEVEVRCGATFGVGTYTSPELTYSLS